MFELLVIRLFPYFRRHRLIAELSVQSRRFEFSNELEASPDGSVYFLSWYIPIFLSNVFIPSYTLYLWK